jgi:stalled ribosome alternative rescue factor ArfA
MKSVKHKPRFQIKWNTGERIEKPVKGKGSFTRKEKHKKKIDPDNQN